jgi:hypothetical protein
MSVSKSGVGLKAILALQPFSDLLCIPTFSILPVVPYLLQSTVSCITES